MCVLSTKIPERAHASPKTKHKPRERETEFIQWNNVKPNMNFQITKLQHCFCHEPEVCLCGTEGMGVVSKNQIVICVNGNQMIQLPD